MTGSGPGSAPTTRTPHDWRELLAVVLLSVTAILTAWTGFQASKWGGAMSISFSQASSARIEAARLDGEANRKGIIQVSMFTQWLQADQAGDEGFAEGLVERFPEPLATAFDAWVDTGALTDPSQPATPFEMQEYAIPELAAAAEADARADAKFDEALLDNQRGDNYTVLTVAFATVLFFAALSGKMHSSRARWALLVLGLAGFAVTTIVLLFYPVLL